MPLVYPESGGDRSGERYAGLSEGELDPWSVMAESDHVEEAVKTTRYFEEQVLRKRPYIRREWCARVVANPLRQETQPDGRIRFWGRVPELGGRVLRVVTLADGETVHNAFPDRSFRP